VNREDALRVAAVFVLFFGDRFSANCRPAFWRVTPPPTIVTARAPRELDLIDD